MQSDAEIGWNDADSLRVLVRALQKHEANVRQDLNEQRAALQEALDARLTRLQDELLRRLACGGGAAAERESRGTSAPSASAAEEFADVALRRMASNLSSSRSFLLGSDEPIVVESAYNSARAGSGLQDRSHCESPGRQPHQGQRDQAVTKASTLTSIQTQPTMKRSITVKPPVMQEERLSQYRLIRRLQLFIGSTFFDLLSTGVVLVNVVLMIVGLELEGKETAVALKLRSDSGVWAGAPAVLNTAEHALAIWFTFELILRYWVFGPSMFRSLITAFDAFMVFATLIDMFLLEKLLYKDGGTNFSFGRMVRLIKLIKLLRTFRAAAVFSELRILVQTVVSSFRALLWSMVLLGLILVACGMFMAQMVLGFLQDGGSNDELLLWAYTYYGSAGRAIYTMFEATLSGCWPNYARRLIQEVSPWYLLFWMLYVVLVGFAVIRVMGALFLSATLRAAGEDEDMMVMRRMKDKERYAQRLRAFFEEADESGDGLLTKEELEKVLQDPMCLAWLHALELEIYEVNALFDCLDDGGKGVTFDEFLGAAMRMKGTAKAIDSITLMSQQHMLRTLMIDVGQKLENIAPLLRTKAPEAPPMWHEDD